LQEILRDDLQKNAASVPRAKSVLLELAPNQLLADGLIKPQHNPEEYPYARVRSAT